MKKKENETNACNAFIEILQKIKGIGYYPESWPERENRNIPDIEVILAPKNKNRQFPKIAVEHTIVEAHANLKLYVSQLCYIEKEINLKCQGKFPTDRHFAIIIPPPLIVGAHKERRNQLIEKIICWAPDAAKNLKIDQRSSLSHNGHEVLLWCASLSFESSGKVVTMRTTPSDYENESRNRFQRSIKEKLPKLLKYKEKEEKFETALLLEDISFSHALPKDDWKDLIPDQYHSEFQLKIDYVVIFVSNEKKMIVGNVWKEGSQIYAEIPDNRRFTLRR